MFRKMANEALDLFKYFERLLTTFKRLLATFSLMVGLLCFGWVNSNGPSLTFQTFKGRSSRCWSGWRTDWKGWRMLQSKTSLLPGSSPDSRRDGWFRGESGDNGKLKSDICYFIVSSSVVEVLAMICMLFYLPENISNFRCEITESGHAHFLWGFKHLLSDITCPFPWWLPISIQGYENWRQV